MSIEVLSVRGLRPEFREVDRDLWLWFCEAKKNHENDDGPRITKRVVQAKAKQAFEAAGISNFKASDGWYIRWIKRWHRMKDYTVSNPEVLKRQRTRKSVSKRSPALKSSASTSQQDGHLFNKPALTARGSFESSCSDVFDKANLNYVGIFQPQTSKSFQSLDNGLHSCQANIKPTSQSIIFHETAKFNATDTVLLMEHGSGSIGQCLESVEIEEESSFLNLDDLTWNDLSDLSCFGRPSETIYTVSGDLKCLPVEQSKTSEQENQNPLQDEKLSAPCPDAVLFNSQGPSQHIDQSIVKAFAPLAKRVSKYGNNIEKNSNVEYKDLTSRNAISGEALVIRGQERPSNSLKSKDTINIVCNHSMTDFINVETACGNFAQNDLEDVSVCSDFVNQTSTEETFKLHPISTKTVVNDGVNSHFWTENNLQPNVLPCSHNSVANTSSMDTINQCISPEPGYHMSVVDDDLSSEDNDYISEAVLLSMQEDDFSILNCDQSPFQGTMSVIDENSQSECEKLCTLDDGSELELPIFSASDCMLTEREHNFPSGGNNKEAQNASNDDTSQEVLFVGDSQGQTGEHQNIFASGMPISSGVVLPCSSDKNQTTEVPSFTSLTPSSIEISNHSPSINGKPVTQERLIGSSILGDAVVEGEKFFKVPALTGKIALIGRDNLIHLSAPQSVHSTVSDQDVFIASCNNFNNLGSLTPTYFSTEDVEYSESSLISDSCILSQNAENNSNTYLVSTSPQDEAGFDAVSQCSTSNIFLSTNMSGGMLKCMQLNSVEVHSDSSSQMLDTNFDSRTDFGSQSSYQLEENSGVTRLMASSCLPLVENASMIQSFNTSSVGIASQDQRNFHLNTVQSEPFASSIRHKLTKENGFISFDLASVENVLSESDVNPGNQSKALKKNLAYLTEKGINTSQVKNVEDKVSSYRRSSGDRYFPYFKEKVVTYAIKHTAKEAARYFGVNVDTVTLWTRGRHESNSVVKNYPDQLMLQWLKRNRESGVLLTKDQVVEKATQLLRTPGNWLKDKTRWFYTWASRFLDEQEKKKRLECKGTGFNNLLPEASEKKALYPDEFKVEVVLYAERTSQNLASNIFNIARRRIFEWSAALKSSKKEDEDTTALSSCKDIQSSHKLPSSTPEIGTLKLKLNGKGTGRAVTSVAVDQELWSWFCEQTANKTKPKSKEIQAKAVELFRARNHDKIQCSHGWLKKWCIRYGVALRHEGDGDLLAWCLEQFDCNRNISHRDLLNYAHKSLTGTHKSEFKASAGWLLRFCKRHKNLLSEKPSIDTEIPSILKHKVSEFRTNIQKFIKTSSLAKENLGCMDEIPLNFTSGASRSRLLLRRSGLENCHATVILGCLANGELLPPAVIFKGDGPTEQVTYNGLSLVIFYQQDCCMNSSIMSQWIDLVWMRNVSSPSLIVADCYDPHCSESVQEKCKASNITLSIMPSGCSFKLQPLDPAISRLFEATIYSRWTRHYTDADQILTCKRTSYSSNTDIAHWVADACITLGQKRKEAVRRSFEVTGLISHLSETDEQYLEDPSYISVTSSFSTL